MIVEVVDRSSVSEVAEEPNTFENGNNSLDSGSIKTKKRRKCHRKRRKLCDSTISDLESIEEGAFPSVLVLPDSLVGNTSSDSSDEALNGHSEKIMREEVAGDGTSFLVAGDTSLGKASGECPDDKSASREQRKKIKMECTKEIINDTSIADVSLLDVVQNEVLDSAEENFHKSTTLCESKASDDSSGSNPSVEKLESDKLGIKTELKDEIPSSSGLGATTDNVSLAVDQKEGPIHKLQSSLPGSLRKKLLVLDVNGLLADIVTYVSDGYKPDTTVSRKAVFKRPFCDDFLQFCFERFNVAVWSSRTKRNVNSVLDFLMGESKRNLLFCWDQSHCTDTGFYTVENRDKPLLLKELNKLWEKHDPDLPWDRGDYNESNTLLLDDSPYKALRNPPNTAIFPHTYQYKDVKDNSLGPIGDLRVYLEGLALADNVQKYVELNPFGQLPITETNLSWSFYLKVIGPTSSLQEEDTNDSLPRQ